VGRQPFGLASPAAWLREAGLDVVCVDLSREKLSENVIRAAGLVAFFLPMHTATRLAVPVIDRVRSVNPAAQLCAYGLYAPLNTQLLREHGVTDVLGGEFEEDLVEIACARRPRSRGAADAIPRLAFRVPDRSGLPDATRYVTLQTGAERKMTGYTEASRGCKHRCRHCPIVPVYDGRFRIVPVDVVIADIRSQVERGAQHITFGDPDFFNGIGHATAVLQAFGREFPGISYDVTIKVEHLLRHADVLPVLQATGCAFVTSAVESIDDDVLLKLEKGHTAADFERVSGIFRETGLTLSPTFVAFTPWTTVEAYCAFLDTIDRLDLVDHVAPIQLAIRLLVTEGSRLLELPDIRQAIGRFNTQSLTYPWRHTDPRVDELQSDIMALVGGRLSAGRRDVFARVWRLAHDVAGSPMEPRSLHLLPRAAVPYLNEPWYC
jgi:radical SAM family protein